MSRKFTDPKEPLFIAPFEVVIHNKPNDCWVSFLGKVYDITPLLAEFQGQDCIKPLISHAGKDISQWFDSDTQDIQHFVHPVTGIKEPYCPFGNLPHVEFSIPSSHWRPLNGLPWWKDDEKYFKGYLTKKVRPLRIINTIICKEIQINVCCEDTFNRIMERYYMFNSDPDSYIWKYFGKPLCMSKTMEENGIIDERETLAELGLPPNLYIPGVFLYYSGDMKYDVEFTVCEHECLCAT